MAVKQKSKKAPKSESDGNGLAETLKLINQNT